MFISQLTRCASPGLFKVVAVSTSMKEDCLDVPELTAKLETSIPEN